MTISDEGQSAERRHYATFESDDERFARNVKAHRELMGWSQGRLATELRERGWDQFHQTTVSRIEKGERPVRIGEARAIAGVLGTLVAVMIAPSDEMKVANEFAARVNLAEAERDNLRRAASQYRSALWVVEQQMKAVLENGYEWAEQGFQASIESKIATAERLLLHTPAEVAAYATKDD